MNLGLAFALSRRECRCAGLVIDATTDKGKPIVLDIENKAEVGPRQFTLSTDGEGLVASYIDRFDQEHRRKAGKQGGYVKHECWSAK